MAHDVFISHAAEDKTAADMLCAMLEQQGVRCWVAPRDVQPGTDWRSAILAAIRSSRAMVLVFSEHANESRHVNREVDCAIEAGIPVVPFRTQDVAPRGALEYSLYGVHWLDAMTPPIDAHMKRLAALLVAMLSGDSRATATLAGSPRKSTLGLADSPDDGSGKTDAADPRRWQRWLALGLGLMAVAVAINVWTFTHKPAPVASAAEPPAPIVPSTQTAPPIAPALNSEAPPPADITAPTSAPVVPADAIMFPGAQGEIFLEVDPSHADDFEAVWKKLVDGLQRSTSADYQTAGRGFVLAKTLNAGKPLYVAYIDPVIRGMNYQPGYLLSNSGAFEPSELDGLYKRITDGVATLRPVPLERINLVPAESTAVDQSPAMGMREAKDAFAFSTDQAQIIWQLKPGKRAEFEAAWRTIIAGLLKSPNERVRQAALSIVAFRTPLETAVIFRMDHPIKGVSYDPGQLMFYAGTFARPDLDDLVAEIRAVTDAVTPWPLSAIR